MENLRKKYPHAIIADVTSQAKDGLDILVDAFVRLKRKGTIPGLRLRIGGGFTATDKPFLKQMRQRLAPYASDVVIEESYKMEEHARFYQQVSLLSVPLRFEEGVGLYLCEAFAAGRPVVEPATGSFPEIVGKAGLLYSPNEAAPLAEALEQLLTQLHTLSATVWSCLTATA